MAQKPQYNLATENQILRQHQQMIINLARAAFDPDDLQFFLEEVVRRVSAPAR
jgi:hypothetical protein